MNKYLYLCSALLTVAFVGKIECLTVDAYARAIVKDLKGADAKKFQEAAASLYKEAGDAAKGVFDDNEDLMMKLYGQKTPKTTGGGALSTDVLPASFAAATKDIDKQMLDLFDADAKSVTGKANVAYGKQVMDKLKDKKAFAARINKLANA